VGKTKKKDRRQMPSQEYKKVEFYLSLFTFGSGFTLPTLSLKGFFEYKAFIGTEYFKYFFRSSATS